jgi:hypothetical protein
MSINPDQKLRIQEVVKDILLSRLNSFPNDSISIRNAPFHNAFLEAFRDRLEAVEIEPTYLVVLASWMHGLNTSLGSGFENIAHILSGGFKRKFTQQFTLPVTDKQSAKIQSIVTGLKSGSRVPNTYLEYEEITSSINPKDGVVGGLGFTADNYIETDTKIECIEMKSVRPNSGEGRGEKEKILFAKAALKKIHPEKDIQFYIGFPFDPTSETPTGYNKERFMNYLIEFKKFFAPEEILIASELWDHLSGQQNTMEQLLDIVTETVRHFREDH